MADLRRRSPDPPPRADHARRISTREAVHQDGAAQGDPADAQRLPLLPLRSAVRSGGLRQQRYFDDLVAVYRAELAELAQAGCRYVQMDEVPVAMLCDPRCAEQAKAEGGDPDSFWTSMSA